MNLFKKRPLACVVLFGLLGSLSAFLLNISGMMRAFAPIPLFLLTILLIVSIALMKKSGILMPIILVAMLVGYFSQMLYDRVTFSDMRGLESTKIHTIEAHITDIKETKSTKSICTVSVISANNSDASGKLMLTLPTTEYVPTKGDMISCSIMVVEYADSYLYRQGIAARAVTEDRPVLIGKKEGGLTSTISEWNTHLQERLYGGMSEENAALLSALLLGNRDTLDATVTRNFRRTGLSHMLALSGLHLSVLALSILYLLRRLGVPRAISLVALLLFVAVYAAIAGFPLSLLRAAGMLLLAELGRFIRLSADAITSLFAALALILLISPGAIADIGLALSFLATLGILLTTSLISGKVRHGSRTRRALVRIRSAIAITLGATFFTLLLSVLVFGEISVISPLSNLLVSPLLHILLLLGPWALAFPAFLNPIVSFFTQATLGLISLLSSIPRIYISASHPLFVAVAILFSLLLVFLLSYGRISKKALKSYLVSGVTILVVTLAACQIYTKSRDYVCYTRTADEDFLFLQSDDAVTVLADGGSAYTAGRIRAALKQEHIAEIDTLIIARYTKETAAFIEALSDAMLIRQIVLCPENSLYADAAMNAAVKGEATPIPIENGTHTIKGGITVTVLSGTRISEQADAFFLRLEYREKRICYAPSSTFSEANTAAIKGFTTRADLVIIGKDPGFKGMPTTDGIFKEATIVIGRTETANEATLLGDNILFEPDQYLYPLK